MTDIEYIASRHTEGDLLCQLAEEAAELAQAALKLRRAITRNNPTPVTEADAKAALIDDMETPYACAKHCGYHAPTYCERIPQRCAECWRRPLEEVER